MKSMLRWAAATTLCVVFASRAGAQQPAAVVPPLRGHVLSVAGFPIADAEVRVEGVKASVRSDAQGAFLVPNVSKGIHEISVRRLGYLPAVTSVGIPQANDSLTVILVPTHVELDTVKVSAKLNVLAGVVVDERNRPISGASVELNGTAGVTATTGDDGWFTFTSVRSGPTILHVLREGYVGTMQSVRLKDWRGLVVHMTRIDTMLSKNRQQIASGLGNSAQRVWIETQQRLAERSVWAVIVTREDLAPLGDMPLGEAITQSESAANLSGDMERSDNSACVLLNGVRVIGQTSLDSYNAVDVEFVELYPPDATPPNSVAGTMRNAGCTARRTQGSRKRGIFYAVIWLRT